MMESPERHVAACVRHHMPHSPGRKNQCVALSADCAELVEQRAASSGHDFELQAGTSLVLPRGRQGAPRTRLSPTVTARPTSLSTPCCFRQAAGQQARLRERRTAGHHTGGTARPAQVGRLGDGRRRGSVHTVRLRDDAYAPRGCLGDGLAWPDREPRMRGGTRRPFAAAGDAGRATGANGPRRPSPLLQVVVVEWPLHPRIRRCPLLGARATTPSMQPPVTST